MGKPEEEWTGCLPVLLLVWQRQVLAWLGSNEIPWNMNAQGQPRLLWNSNVNCANVSTWLLCKNDIYHNFRAIHLDAKVLFAQLQCEPNIRLWWIEYLLGLTKCHITCSGLFMKILMDKIWYLLCTLTCRICAEALPHLQSNLQMRSNKLYIWFVSDIWHHICPMKIWKKSPGGSLVPEKYGYVRLDCQTPDMFQIIDTLLFKGIRASHSGPHGFIWSSF